MKKILLSIGLGVMLLVGGVAHATEVRDCDANAIMWCGAYSKTEWAYKLVGGDKHNAPANLQAIYGGFGVLIDEMKQAVDGVVTKDGRVMVNGQVVATGAQSAGRRYMPTSVKQHGVWLRSTNVSFNSPQLDAYVYRKNGVFEWAIIKACGNVVIAQPIIPKPTPVAPAAPLPPIVPSAPPSLPDTGMELPVAAALGTTSMGFGLRHYLKSKRILNAALRHK